MTVPEEVMQLVGSSGNNFHAKVARWLQANGWHVAISPYYLDQTQNKAREIDLVAERTWPVIDVSGRPSGDVAVRLFIECKFVPTYSVFWFTQKDMDAANSLVCAQAGFRSGNMYTQKHHYLSSSSRVAKLFATPVARGSETDPYYRALNQVLNAMVAMRGGPVSVPALKKKNRSPMAILELPIVVCSSFQQVYGVDFYSDSPPEKVGQNFQLEIQYAYLNRRGEQRDEYVLLDFVEFERLGEFMNLIDEDGKAAAFFAQQD